MNCCALLEKKRAWKCAKILLDNDATDEYCIYIIVVYRVNEKYFRERATNGSKIGGYINLLGEYLSIAKVYRCFIHSKLLASGKSHLILQAASLNGVWFHSFIVWERVENKVAMNGNGRQSDRPFSMSIVWRSTYTEQRRPKWKVNIMAKNKQVTRLTPNNLLRSVWSFILSWPLKYRSS